MQHSLIVNKSPFYYGWVILAAGTLGMIMTSPGQTYAAVAAALLFLALAMGLVQMLTSVALALLYGVMLGTTTGLYRTVANVAWAHYFGRKHLGAISGVASTIMIIGAAVGPIPLGVARDVTGSYNLALSLLALIPLALSVVSLLWLKPVRQG